MTTSSSRTVPRLRRAAQAALLGLAVLASCSTVGAPVRPAEKLVPGSSAPGGRGTAHDLYAAAADGDLARVKSIVKQSPRLVTAVDAAGWSVLNYAAWSGQKGVFDYLAARGGLTNLFTEAALGPWPDVVKRMQTHPAAVQDRDLRQQATPLLWAARAGNAAAGEYLLALGAEVDAADREGNTALHFAVSRGDAQLCRALLQAGAAAGAADRRGRTPLYLACAGGPFELIELLLDRGAPIAAADQDGDTPLHAAAARGSFEICEYLLLRGAPAGVKNRRGQTARDLAIAGGHGKLAELLKERP